MASEAIEDVSNSFSTNDKFEVECDVSKNGASEFTDEVSKTEAAEILRSEFEAIELLKSESTFESINDVSKRSTSVISQISI